MTNYDILKEYEAHKTPVPSYEEYNRLKEVERKKGKLVNVNYKIKQENQKLKELLMECKSSILFEADVVKETSGKHSNEYKMLSALLTRINTIIGTTGEKK